MNMLCPLGRKIQFRWVNMDVMSQWQRLHFTADTPGTFYIALPASETSLTQWKHIPPTCMKRKRRTYFLGYRIYVAPCVDHANQVLNVIVERSVLDIWLSERWWCVVWLGRNNSSFCLQMGWNGKLILLSYWMLTEARGFGWEACIFGKVILFEYMHVEDTLNLCGRAS